MLAHACCKRICLRWCESYTITERMNLFNQTILNITSTGFNIFHIGLELCIFCWCFFSSLHSNLNNQVQDSPPFSPLSCFIITVFFAFLSGLTRRKLLLFGVSFLKSLWWSFISYWVPAEKMPVVRNQPYTHWTMSWKKWYTFLTFQFSLPTMVYWVL